MKRTFFLLGACSLLALFSGNKASAEKVETDCGIVYYAPDGAFSPTELKELQDYLNQTECIGTEKKRDAYPGRK